MDIFERNQNNTHDAADKYVAHLHINGLLFSTWGIKENYRSLKGRMKAIMKHIKQP